MFQATFAGVKNLLIGMGVTFRNMLTKPVTIQYPEVKRVMPARYRGRPVSYTHLTLPTICSV